MPLQVKTYSQVSNTYTLEITITENSTSTPGNSSSVAYVLKLKSSSKNFTQYGVGASVKLDGKQVAYRDRKTAPQITLGTYSEVTLLSGTVTIGHNTDGSKSMSISYSLDMAAASYTPGPMSGSATMTLTKIPRGATITSAPNFTDEDNPVVTVSNPAGVSVQLGIFKDSTHALADYRTISGTSYTFRLTQAEREAMQKVDITKNASQVRFYVKSTVGGQTFITYLVRTLTIKNPAPTLSPVVVDTNPLTVGLTGNSNTMVRFHSNAKVTTGAEGVKYATIKSQSVSCAGKVLSGNGTINGVGSGDFKISATDSRGNTTEEVVKKPLILYIEPTCYIQDGILTALGQFTFKTSGVAFNDSFGAKTNTVTAEYRYRVASGAWNGWAPMSIELSGNEYAASAQISGLDYKMTYEFQGRVIDSITTVESSIKTISSIPGFEWWGDRFNFNIPVSITTINPDGSKNVRWLVGCGMTARIASTVALTGGEKKLPITLSLCDYGGASVSNGDILVPNTGVYEVSASVYFVSTAASLYCGAYIRSNGEEISSFHTGVSNGVGGVTLPPTLVKLDAGDTVSLSAYLPTGGNATVDNDPRTRLTVKQVY